MAKKTILELQSDEDIRSSSEKEKEIRRKPVENMKLRRAKEADHDICAIKMPYLTNQEEFIHETGFDGFYTQKEHAANCFHIKRINVLEDMSFSRDLSMQSGDTPKGPEVSGTFLTCTRKHQITWNQRRQYLPFLDAHIWRNKAPTTNLSKLQRFGDIINSSGSLQLQHHPPEYSESTKTRIAIFGVKSHQFPTALFSPGLE
ncbi:hypothetical protein F2Q70_00006846 [Brassica cretica]|uniref:Uncharacterized protein n=2 Tax=Brassica cretica TaxID=69181 RepID=A0A8S9FYW4_BRACR|nr:hypothetical protein F2Q68_00023518 [Brassica cretica]KAF2573241.1 hypothetical protein F2Q70_00006846 [Brassica cretica]KAF3566912.1 hypothetical protein DY000_02019928 [Brassica cretica]